MKHLIKVIAVLIISLTLTGMIVADGEITPVPDVTVIPDPTAEPTLVTIPIGPVDPLPGQTSDIVTPNFIWVIVILGIAIFLVIRERNFKALIDAMERKDVRNELERQYAHSSIATKDLVSLAKAGVVYAAGLDIPALDGLLEEGADFLDDITDGEEDDA